MVQHRQVPARLVGVEAVILLVFPLRSCQIQFRSPVKVAFGILVRFLRLKTSDQMDAVQPGQDGTYQSQQGQLPGSLPIRLSEYIERKSQSGQSDQGGQAELKGELDHLGVHPVRDHECADECQSSDDNDSYAAAAHCSGSRLEALDGEGNQNQQRHIEPAGIVVAVEQRKG
ncbi:hypothetical protein SDC9_159444 [bioreactor metagenome]|uniref:Uncharacterized protein n=1 Tax=bioreactor metagenome TaxID=1076179 RepID=A0A645FF71_9ZZZZ